MSIDGGHPAGIDRRRFLRTSCLGGLGGLPATHLLTREPLGGRDIVPRHHAPTARRVVQLFMSGAASQCDLFDYKPELIARNGQPWDPGEAVELFQSKPGNVMGSPWSWRQHGECGRWMSGLVPHLATCVDDIAFVHSMTSRSKAPARWSQQPGKRGCRSATTRDIRVPAADHLATTQI